MTLPLVMQHPSCLLSASLPDRLVFPHAHTLTCIPSNRWRLSNREVEYGSEGNRACFNEAGAIEI